jgi:hypothetical protein
VWEREVEGEHVNTDKVPWVRQFFLRKFKEEIWQGE